MIHLGKTTPLVIAMLCLMGLVANPAPAAKADNADTPDSRLGAPFSSLAAGIAFRPPVGAAAQRCPGIDSDGTGDLVQYSNRQEKWALKVSRLMLDRPTRLRNPQDEKETFLDASQAKTGLLDETVRQLQLQNSATKILRNDLANVGAHDVGIIATRFTQGAQTWLRQQAFVQASSRLYYVFDFTTPSGHAAADKPGDEDPAEAMAVEIFTAMLDSVQVLDQRPLIEANRDRLFRTRALQVNMPKRLQQAAQPEQYFRVLRDGKDIGWSFVCEDMGDWHGKNGIFVAMLSHGQPEGGTAIDLSTEMFATLDFKTATEAWVSTTTVNRGGKKEQIAEIGQSDRRVRRVFDEQNGLPDEKDRRQPKVQNIEQYSFSVTQTTQAADQPATKQPEVTRQLKPYYLPQAIGWMLPRSIPLTEAKTYLFSWWVASDRELGYRYIDVEAEREVKFNGQKVRAIVIKDRLGYEGDVTLHYVAPDGKYLGSFSPGTAVTVVASDQKTLTRIWPDAVMVRPHLLDTATTGVK